MKRLRYSVIKRHTVRSIPENHRVDLSVGLFVGRFVGRFAGLFVGLALEEVLRESVVVEKVIVSPNDFEVRLRANGIEHLVLELRPEPVEQQAEAMA